MALAILSLMDGNLLLLDEPTNHLDLRSQEILEQALLEYTGTIILVSHDRALLEALATQVWQIEDGWLKVFKHGFAEYRRYRARAIAQRGTERQVAAKQEDTPVPASGQEKRSPEKKNDDKHNAKKHATELTRIEEEIARLEEELSRVEGALATASNSGDSDEITKLGLQHQDLSSILEREMRNWEDTAHDGAVDQKGETR